MATVIAPGIDAGTTDIKQAAERDAAGYTSVKKALDSAFRKPDLVKGAGYVTGQKPLEDYTEIIDRLGSAQDSMARATYEGFHNGPEVKKSIAPEFQNMLQAAFTGGPNGAAPWMSQVTEAIQSLGADLGKNFTLTSPLSTGFVPFNLLAPSRLIYPFYSPMRNKLQRTQGQGTALRTKLVVGIQGSKTGGATGNPKNMFISELSGASIASPGGTWPNQLPPSGAQNAADLTLNYSFQGISEALTWPAQFASQGFEDLSGLANLILLQEAMLAEEYQILGSTATAIGAPSAAPTLTARTAGSGETALSGVTTNVYVRITATNFTGETVSSAVANTAVSAGQVVDVHIKGQPLAALAFNIYVGTGTTDPGVSGSHLMASGVGGVSYTLMGALPTATATPPTADTGTASANGYEGMFSVTSGWAAQNSVYPSGFLGGYVNKSVGDTLNLNVLQNALVGLWDGGTTNTGYAGSSWTSAGGFRVNPAELIAEGSDVGNLSDSIVLNGSGNNYLLTVDQNQVSGVTGGVAVSQVVNPVTRDIVKVLVHPWLPQGNALLNSYSLSQPWSNVANVWEVNNVQDYLSISWPVIDMSFRYSIALYGTLVCFAPQYNAVLGGLQRNDGNGTSTPWS
ncbi:hypothetical protein ORV05_04945 [Amycolatopsis cynarae]|uniref:Uncharacterized protein n=1 Tax=Amycolatopsis cynarae TaxID=2995223 RepID=A0ABY7B5D0_9PSEU|nr:hypothetical protein [Amycolatopsis sp. HUAS 11-8]WAL67139.1 hypothetical protein ORV05_04945 [Amycolatopsis sp. HUAS 11-8]